MDADLLLERLLDGGVDFVIIGGVAAVLHGSTLLTRDLDVCIPLGAESLMKLQAALRSLNPRVKTSVGLVPLELDVTRAGQLRNIYISTDEGRLDCLGYVDGLGDYAAVLRESQEIQLGRRRVRLLGIDGLIRSKEAAGRPHDMQTVAQLRAIRERRQDRPVDGG